MTRATPGPGGLEALQQAFQAYVLDESAGRSAAAGGPVGGTAGVAGPALLAGALAVPPGVDAGERLAIYHHAYRARLVDALRDSHGHTAAYLGDERFGADALAYLAEHPPRHPNLRWFGDAWPHWLAARYPRSPEVAELAMLDQALRRAFDGPDAPALTLQDLAAVPPAGWEHAVLAFHPTCERLRLACNTVALWQALDDDLVPPPAEALPQALAWVVWRAEWQPSFRSLAPLEDAALACLQGGTPFGPCCEQLAREFAGLDIARHMGGLLRRWVEEGMLAGIAVPGPAQAAQ